MFIWATRVEYLGHIITSSGVKFDQGKIKAMLNWPRPTSVNKLLQEICSQLWHLGLSTLQLI